MGTGPYVKRCYISERFSSRAAAMTFSCASIARWIAESTCAIRRCSLSAGSGTTISKNALASTL